MKRISFYHAIEKYKEANPDSVIFELEDEEEIEIYSVKYFPDLMATLDEWFKIFEEF